MCAWTGNSINYNVAGSCRGIDTILNGSANDIISSYQNWGTGTYSCLASYQNAGYVYRLWFTASAYHYRGSGIDNWVEGANDKASSHSWQTC